MNFSKKEIEKYYEESAPWYRIFWFDSKSSGMHYGYQRDSAEVSFRESLLSGYKDFLKWTNPKEGERILDAGCGVGGGSILFFEAHESRGYWYKSH